MTSERIPDISKAVPRRSNVEWTEGPTGRITIMQPRGGGGVRRGFLRLFGVPRVLRINLDPLGSEVWRLIDGSRTVAAIRESLLAKFPEETDLNRRLGQFFSVMVSKKLVELTSGGDGPMAT